MESNQKVGWVELAEESAAWMRALRAPTSQTYREFALWVRKSPKHVSELLFMTALGEALREIDPSKLRICDDTERKVSGKVSTMPFLAATAAALLAVVAFAVWQESKPFIAHSAEVGAYHRIRLDDGSLVELNTRTRAATRTNWRNRSVRLLEGEAYFTVARDELRPFQVDAEGISVEALGTQFNVRRHTNGRTDVVVLEGRVRINVHGRSNSGIPELVAGQSATWFGGDSRLLVKSLTPAEAARTASWRRGRLTFNGQTLAEAAEEFNRYNSQKLIIEDDEASELRISGIFDLRDPELFSATVRQLFPKLVVSRHRAQDGSNAFHLGYQSNELGQAIVNRAQ